MATGRAQAKAIGAPFWAQEIDATVVRSSQWCRCLYTARLLDLGEVLATPALNSFFSGRAQNAAQADTVRALLAEAETGQPTVRVMHRVNITELSDVFPASGEIVVLQPFATVPDVVGRIAPS